MKRIFAISDLHVDYKQNMDWVRNLSQNDYKNDTLIVAGDISDNTVLFSKALTLLTNRFQNVAFVPGNHDLWIRRSEVADSLEKFYLLNDICEMIGVKTKTFSLNSNQEVQIQPLFSWYVKPEEGADSLFLPKRGEDESLSMWADNRAIKWPALNGYRHSAEMFIKLNSWQEEISEAIPTITFTHFLPRQELIFSGKRPPEPGKYIDPVPRFNFSRVAGSSLIDEQIRKIGSDLHIYGHQHRNRCKRIDGITYIAHGLGYPKERYWGGIDDSGYQPKLIWDSENGFVACPEY